MNITYSKSAVKNIKSINAPFKKQIKSAIEKLPDGDIKKLRGYNNIYRLRVGEYRVIYKVLKNEIYIEGILPRGGAYKRL